MSHVIGKSRLGRETYPTPKHIDPNVVPQRSMGWSHIFPPTIVFADNVAEEIPLEVSNLLVGEPFAELVGGRVVFLENGLYLFSAFLRAKQGTTVLGQQASVAIDGGEVVLTASGFLQDEVGNGIVTAGSASYVAVAGPEFKFIGLTNTGTGGGEWNGGGIYITKLTDG